MNFIIRVMSVGLCALAFTHLGAAERSNRPVTLNLPPKVDVGKLTTVIGNLVGVSMQYNPQRVRGTVALELRDTYSAEEIWAIYNDILASQGLATVLSGTEPAVFQVVALNEAPALSTVLTPDQLDALSLAPSYAIVMLELEHLAPAVAVKMLTPLLTGPSTQIRTVGEGGNRLVVSALLTRVQQARHLIKVIDVPDVMPVIERYTPQFATPQSLQAGLSATLAAQGRIHGSQVPVEFQISPDQRAIWVITTSRVMPQIVTMLRQLDEGEPRHTHSYSTGDYLLGDVAALLNELFTLEEGQGRQTTIEMVQNELTGRLVVSATTAQHARIASVLAELAAVPMAHKRTMELVPIKHRVAADMARLVQDLLQGAGGTELLANAETSSGESAAAPANTEGVAAAASDADDSSTAVSPNEAPADSTQRTMQEKVAQVSVDETSNTLVVMGTPRQIAEIKHLVAILDQRQPQVAIEITMLFLRDGESLDLGTALGGLFNDGTTNYNLASLLNLNTVTGDGDSEVLESSGQGISGLIINPGDYAVLINAAETITDSTAMVTTQLLVNNNAEASLDSVRQEPIGDLNSSEQVTTTTFGGTSDAGTQISITPQISPADEVNLSFTVSQSDFDGSGVVTGSGAALPPAKRSDSVNSVVTIPDGHTIVQGGLISSKSSDEEIRVPLLGRIPILGWLFKTRKTTTEGARFFIFIRASVMRDDQLEDLKFISERKMQELSLEDPDWPALTPRFIE